MRMCPSNVACRRSGRAFQAQVYGHLPRINDALPQRYAKVTNSQGRIARGQNLKPTPSWTLIASTLLVSFS